MKVHVGDRQGRHDIRTKNDFRNPATENQTFICLNKGFVLTMDIVSVSNGLTFYLFSSITSLRRFRLSLILMAKSTFP